MVGFVGSLVVFLGKEHISLLSTELPFSTGCSLGSSAPAAWCWRGRWHANRLVLHEQVLWLQVCSVLLCLRLGGPRLQEGGKESVLSFSAPAGISVVSSLWWVWMLSNFM